MEAPLAIYEALVHANAPVDAARNAAEKLERDMTQALAIRQDLQRLEANVQRLEARVESGFAMVDERIASVREDMNSRFSAMQKDMDVRFSAMDEKMDARFSAMEEKMDSRFLAIGARFSLMDERFVSFENRILIKLGALMVALFTIAIGVLALTG